MPEVCRYGFRSRSSADSESRSFASVSAGSESTSGPWFSSAFSSWLVSTLSESSESESSSSPIFWVSSSAVASVSFLSDSLESDSLSPSSSDSLTSELSLLLPSESRS